MQLHPDLSWRAVTPVDAPALLRLFTRAGLAPLRWYASLKRDLADLLPDVLVPDGIRLAEWTPGDDEEVRAWPISLRPEGAGGPIFLLTHPAIARAVARQAHGGAAVRDIARTLVPAFGGRG